MSAVEPAPRRVVKVGAPSPCTRRKSAPGTYVVLVTDIATRGIALTTDAPSMVVVGRMDEGMSHLILLVEDEVDVRQFFVRALGFIAPAATVLQAADVLASRVFQQGAAA